MKNTLQWKDIILFIKTSGQGLRLLLQFWSLFCIELRNESHAFSASFAVLQGVINMCFTFFPI